MKKINFILFWFVLLALLITYNGQTTKGASEESSGSTETDDNDINIIDVVPTPPTGVPIEISSCTFTSVNPSTNTIGSEVIVNEVYD